MAAITTPSHHQKYTTPSRIDCPILQCNTKKVSPMCIKEHRGEVRLRLLPHNKSERESVFLYSVWREIKTLPSNIKRKYARALNAAIELSTFYSNC